MTYQPRGLTIEPFKPHPTKWSNTLKQFVTNLPTNCLSVFDHFVILARKGLRKIISNNFLSVQKGVCQVTSY